MRTRIIVLSLLTTLLPSALGQFDTLLGGKASIGATSHGNLSTGVTPRSPNVLERLALEKRQFVCDAGPGGPICSATTCCAAGKRCCGNPPNGCCPSDTTCFGTNECCPSGAQTCGGSTCCTSGSSCCTSSPTGCCVGGAVCCQSKTTPCCPSGSTCCGDTCCLSGETCDQGSCINSSHIASGRVARFQFDAKKNGQLLHNMCVGMGGRNTMELNYAGKLTDREKKTRRGSSGCAAGFCQSRGTAGLSSCEEYPPVMSGTGAGTLLNLTTAVVNCIPAIQNARQGGIYGQMIANSSIAAGQTFTVSVDCDNVLKATLPPATGELTLPKSGLTTTDNVFPADASIKEAVASIVVAFGDLKAGTCTVDYKVNGGAIDGGALIVDNLGDHYAASTKTALDQGQSDSLSFSIGAGGEAMGVGLLLPSRNANDTVISWSIQCQELPPEADTSDDGSSGGGSSGGGGGGSNGGSSGGFFGGSSRSHSGQNHLLWVLVAILSLAVLL